MYVCICMPQLHLSVSETLAASLRRDAEAAGVTLSTYLARIVARQVAAPYPDGFLEQIVGGWQGEPLERPPQGQLDRREELAPRGRQAVRRKRQAANERAKR